MAAPFRLRPKVTPVLAAAAASLLSACTHVESTGSVYPSDYRERHPIVLAHAPKVLDVFVVGARGYEARERQDVGAFLGEWRSRGTGPLLVQVPVGTGQDGAIRATASRIRASAGGRAVVSTYSPADPMLASPIRLSFRTLQAKVGSTCGLWPQDLGVSDVEFTTSNRPYWNNGCALQNALASQVADPVDLVRGRQSTPPDTIRRMGAFEKLRQGGDPSTQYNTQTGSVRAGISD